MGPDTCRRVLGLWLLAVAVWGSEGDEDAGGSLAIKPFKVSISGSRVVLTCPLEPDTGTIEWKKNDEKKSSEGLEFLMDNFSEMEDSGLYTCATQEKSFHLYLRARVCENCMELDLMTVASVVVVDVCVTLGLLVLVYYWSKNRKAKAKPVTRGAAAGGRPRGQNKERPPPVPNPDYEPIRKGQRDLYAGLNQRGI